MSNYFADIGVWPRAAHSMGRAYAWGFVLSLLLTMVSFGLTLLHVMAPHMLVPVLLLLALGQFVVQVVNFLHVSGRPDSRERLIVLLFAVAVVLIVVIGSLWIMQNLDARMMPDTAHMERYMVRQPGL